MMRRRSGGFTLIELVMVIVLLGVLAAYVAPSFTGTALNDRGLHDETLAYLRYAQKTAVAQRRTVCVAFTNTTLTLSIASAAGATDCSSAGTLTGPKGDSPPVVTAKSGVTYSGTPVSFNFDGLGQPRSATTGAVITAQASLPAFAVNGLAGKSITVEVGTGYVHD